MRFSLVFRKSHMNDLPELLDLLKKLRDVRARIEGETCARDKVLWLKIERALLDEVLSVGVAMLVSRG